MSDYNIKLQNYKKALNKLIEGIDRYDEKDDLLRDGIIQRFEFTFELAWKTLKFIFEEEGLIGLNSPKSVLKEAFSAELIDNEVVWLNMLKDRNSTVHIYSEQVAKKICNNIQEVYSYELKRLVDKIEERILDVDF